MKNITITAIRADASYIYTFGVSSWKKAYETAAVWVADQRRSSLEQPIVRIFMCHCDSNSPDRELLEYTPQEVIELAYQEVVR